MCFVLSNAVLKSMPINDVLQDPSAVLPIIERAAAEEILPRFRQLEDHEINAKDSGEIVTAADIGAEKILTADLLDLLPGSVVVGEEGASADPSVLDHLKGPEPVWIVDPLDGTKNFAAGLECFAVIVALCHNQKTLGGWIYNPITGTSVSAALGKGAWHNGQRLEVSQRRGISEMTGSIGPRRRKRLEERAGEENLELPEKFTRYNCAGMEYFDLARGVLDFVEFYSLKPWDHAAGVLIHAEAGGYSAETDEGAPYIPQAQYHARLLMAADRGNWEQVKQLLDDG